MTPSSAPAWAALQSFLATAPQPPDASWVGPVTAANREAAAAYAVDVSDGDTADALVQSQRMKNLAYLLAAIQGVGTGRDIQGVIQAIQADSGGFLAGLTGGLSKLALYAALGLGAYLILPRVLARSRGPRRWT